MTSSPWLFPVYNCNFDIQKKHKSSNIHVSLALSPLPSTSHHQDYYLFIFTCEVENSSKLSLVTITGKGGQTQGFVPAGQIQGITDQSRGNLWQNSRGNPPQNGFNLEACLDVPAS